MTGGRILTALVWLVPGLSLYALSSFLTLGSQLLVFGTLSIVFGVWAFYVHGGPQVTGAGVYCGASGVFVGYASIWWHNYLDSNIPPELLTVTSVSYFATVLMYVLFWWNTRKPIDTSARDPRTAHWATVTGMIIAGIALVAYTIVPLSVSYFIKGIAFVGIVLATIGITGSRRPTKVLGFQTLIIAVLISWYIYVAFNGYGRLAILSLISAVGIAYSMRRKTRDLKVLALAMVPLASVVLTALRLDRQGGSLSEAASQPDSDISGLWTFARLVASPHQDPAWGETFWAAVTIWIPRVVWPDKPVGLGAELTALLEPHLLQSGHSMVATAYGEWFWNFGWWGYLLIVPMVGLAVKWLDKSRKILGSPLDSRRAILFAVLSTIAIATLTDFVWNGTHTYAARMLYRTGAIIGLLLIFGVPARKSVLKTTKNTHLKQTIDKERSQ